MFHKGLLLAAALADSTSPVGRVVQLIRALKNEVEADGKTEQQTYDKFACWCEDTSARKTKDIDDANARLTDLRELIRQNSGRKGTFEAEINTLAKDIKGNLESQAEATGIRNKQHTTFVAMKTESDACIAALKHAIDVLDGAGTGRTVQLQQAESLSVVRGVSRALEMLPTSSSDLVSDHDRELISQFLKDPSAQVHGASFLQHNPFGDYAPASTQVVGIMKNMLDTFTADLESATEEEKQQLKAFEQLMKTKADELDTLQKTKVQKTNAAAANGEALTEQKLERSNLQEQEKQDTIFLQETKENCRDNADAWAERSRLRTEELAGIDKAIDILSSNEDLFTRSSNDFLQISRPAVKNAYIRVQDLARKHQSLRLAALAVKIKEGGHFDDVIAIVDKMIEVIRREDKHDIGLKDQCQQDYEILKSEKGDLTHLIKKNDNKLELLQKEGGNLSDRIGEVEKEIADTKQELKDALEDRAAARIEFQKALKDDRQAAEVIGQAMDVLKAFYKNNKKKLGLVAKEVLFGPPQKFKEDPNKAPEGFAGKSYGGRSSESGGIVSILGMLKENVINEMNEDQNREKKAEEDMRKMQKQSQKSIDALKKTKVTLNTALAQNAWDQSLTEKAGNNLKNQDGNNGGSFKSHCNECEWIYNMDSPELKDLMGKCPGFAAKPVSGFEERKQARADELQGLQDARNSLAGAEEEEPAP